MNLLKKVVIVALTLMSLLPILQTRFGFENFRPNQEAICQAVANGEDTLIVMPTGAGKSLCYQIPGLARGGTTLVISPLVALIEDQVARLAGLQIRAGRIHSGRTREESRDTFKRYLQGDLDFLFIAPERLSVPGFAELLTKHPPRLIAVDEAHCISQWGHDFRPDYRLVGERLQNLKHTPIVALTATATRRVQQDICLQLRMRSPRLFIHGFRRENLAIHLYETPPSERMDFLADVLSEKTSFPAIVYAPTRKKAEEIAKHLRKRGRKQKWKCQAYHAGMETEKREKVQNAFLAGELDIIVATVAFGMGIDKPNVRTIIHAALPGSIEGYYQEIGRAGRDGLRSKAVLMYSSVDRKTHEFFIQKDFPKKYPSRTKGASDESQKTHRLNQLDAIESFTRAPECRMQRLVHYFGDQQDSHQNCKICDRCTPASNTLNKKELGIAALILVSLEQKDGQAAGRLFEDTLSNHPKIKRLEFDRILEALNKARLVSIHTTSFEKGGRKIPFKRIEITDQGRSTQGPDLHKLFF